APDGRADQGPGPTTALLSLRVDPVHPQSLSSLPVRCLVEVLDAVSLEPIVSAVDVDLSSGQSQRVTILNVTPGLRVVRAHFYDATNTLVAEDQVSAELVVGRVVEVTLSPLSLPTPVVPPREFVLVTDSANVYSFQVNLDTGALTPAPGSPLFYNTDFPNNIAISADGRFAYIDLGGSGQVAQLAIDDQTGALTEVSRANSSGPQGSGIAIAGSFLVVPIFSSQMVDVFAINPTTGGLTLQGTFPAGVTETQRIYAHPNGQFLYLAESATGSDPGNIVCFQLSSTGVLTLTEIEQAFPDPPGRTYDFQASPDGTVLYVTGNDPSVNAFDISSSDGSLTPKAGFPVLTPAPFFLGGLAVDPVRQLLLVVGFDADSVFAYPINSDNTLGALAATLGTPSTPFNLALDPSGDNLFVTGYTSPGTITSYHRQNNGPLMSAGTLSLTNMGSSSAFAVAVVRFTN
ncbi:MAG: beta-propeller fold lactonase family protein, partial [Candidatus Eremiobacteraeota bacterium]|nr:beta-propeller fold lactonase family protein [Candidatus Eremiobacteraeota bacterium]